MAFALRPGMIPLLLSLVFAADSVDDAVSAARAHPSLAEAQLSAEAASTAADVAGAWADPMLGVELSNATVDGLALSHPMSGVQLRLSQKLLLSGGARTEAARDMAAAVAVQEEVRGLALETRVRSTWARAGAAHALAELVEAHAVRIGEIRAVATKHYEVGHGGQSALLRLDVLERRLGDQAAEWRREAGVWETALEDLCGEAVSVSSRPAVVPPAEELLVDHPELARLQALEDAKRSQARLQRREALPDPTVMAGYRLRTEAAGGTDLVSLGVSVPLPAGSARTASGRSASLELEADATRAGRLATEQKLAAELAASLLRWSRAAERAATYGEELVPDARQARDATLADYSVGRAAFSDVVEAEVALLELEEVAIRAAAETEVQAAVAHGLTGR